MIGEAVQEIGLHPMILIPIIILIAVVVICGIIVLIGVVFGEGFHFYGTAAPLGAISGAFLASMMVVLIAIELVPYDSKYWMLYSVTGEMDTVTTSFNQNSDSITNNYLVTLKDDPRVYILDDPRTLQLEGEVDFTCSIEFVWESADRYNCSIR